MTEVDPTHTMKKIIRVKQRVQTIVEFEELDPDGIHVKTREVIVESFDRSIPEPLT